MITPVVVLHTFAAQHVVRYAQPPSLCTPKACSGLDDWGGGIAGFFAPAGKPDFEAIVFRTPADAAKVVALFGRGQPVAATRRGNAGLFVLRASRRAAYIRTLFGRIRP